jgi:hypothetical protein
MSSKLRGPITECSSVKDVEHAITLIRTGRAKLAIPILENLPAKLKADVIEACGQARWRSDSRWARRMVESNQVHEAAIATACREGHEQGLKEGRAEGRRKLERRDTPPRCLDKQELPS